MKTSGGRLVPTYFSVGMEHCTQVTCLFCIAPAACDKVRGDACDRACIELTGLAVADSARDTGDRLSKGISR